MVFKIHFLLYLSNDFFKRKSTFDITIKFSKYSMVQMQMRTKKQRRPPIRENTMSLNGFINFDRFIENN
ncbi:hypothetical protein BpHYR1_001412 [Brachionus plicatilis]|uniref:Uncharacterized protein n=1 Tax=Brachionus plicatilis TaxID=10195 RepID=A0A3M7RWT4_BRAPC|nr:hypothetical protein BpHYR1_001412 [Brachionus plicatilis]